jgi:hypothetical protein
VPIFWLDCAAQAGRSLGYQKRSQLFVIVLSLSLYAAILEIDKYGCQGDIRPLLISPPVQLVHLSALLWFGSGFGQQKAGWPSGRHDGHSKSRRTVPRSLLSPTGATFSGSVH